MIAQKLFQAGGAHKMASSAGLVTKGRIRSWCEMTIKISRLVMSIVHVIWSISIIPWHVIGTVSRSCVQYSLSAFKSAKLSFRWQQHAVLVQSNNIKLVTLSMSRMCIIYILFSISNTFFILFPSISAYVHICMVVSSLARISVAIMSPSESFADIIEDRFRFHVLFS